VLFAAGVLGWVHGLAEEGIDAGLVAGAGASEPGEDVGVDANGDGTFDGAVERGKSPSMENTEALFYECLARRSASGKALQEYCRILE